MTLQNSGQWRSHLCSAPNNLHDQIMARGVFIPGPHSGQWRSQACERTQLSQPITNGWTCPSSLTSLYPTRGLTSHFCNPVTRSPDLQNAHYARFLLHLFSCMLCNEHFKPRRPCGCSQLVRESFCQSHGFPTMVAKFANVLWLGLTDSTVVR